MERTESFHGHPLGAVGWVARALQVFSSIIVLGITAWAVTETKTVTVIYTLVINSVGLKLTRCRLLGSHKLRGQKTQMACLDTNGG
ncbi:unnamed protein product [Penicillium manginii]